MSEKKNVPYLAVFAYFAVVIGGCVLAAVLPAYLGLPACEGEADKSVRNNFSADVEPAALHPEIRERRNAYQNEEFSKKVSQLDAEELAPHPYFLRKIGPNVPKKRALCPEVTNPVPGETYPWYEPRLPFNAYPTHYALEFFLNSPSNTSLFDGYAVITINLDSETQWIIIHSKKLLTNYEILEDKDGEDIEIECVGMFLPHDYLIIKTVNPIRIDQTPITFETIYKGDFRVYEQGLFEFEFGREEPKKTMIGSRFEPLEARTAFPCFDEPHYKALYTIKVIHPESTTVLSNAMAVSDDPIPNGDGNLLTTFKETKPLPTYFVAILVFKNEDFDHVDATSNSGVKLRLWAQKDQIVHGSGDGPLDMSVKILNELEDIFSKHLEALPEKLDIFAIPEYEMDAIPHQGLAVFIENRILFGVTASERDVQTIGLLIAKQLAEIWFGNYVTFNWWDELWLQESLSDHYKYKVIEQAYPDWNIHDQFVTEELISLLISDAYPSSHPLQKPINNQAEIEEYFDDVELEKGAAILRMVEAELTEQKFQESIDAYLSAHPFGIGDQNSFLSKMGNIRKWSAFDFFNRWVLQANYPSIFVEIKKENGKNLLHIIQERAAFAGSPFQSDLLYPSQWDFVWLIPLRCAFGKSETDDSPYIHNFDVDTKEFQELIGDGTVDYQWVQCDRDFAAYYSTAYLNSNFEALGRALEVENKAFEPTDHVSIIHSLFFDAYTGRTNYRTLSDVLAYLHDEVDYLPWRAVYQHVNNMISILEYRQSFYPVARFFTTMVHNVENKIDLWTPSGVHVEELLKETLLELACRLQDTRCLKKASEMWPLAVASLADNIPNPIPPFARSVVYNYHFQNTYDVEDWNKMFYLYEALLDYVEHERFLEALTFTRLPWLLADFLTSKDGVEEIDFFTAIEDLSRNPIGREIAWDFMRMHHGDLVDFYGPNDPRLGRMLLEISKTFENEFLYFELLDFVFYTQTGASMNARFKSLEIVTTNIFWLETNEDNIMNAFGPKGASRVDKNKSLKMIKLENMMTRMKEKYNQVKAEAMAKNQSPAIVYNRLPFVSA